MEIERLRNGTAVVLSMNGRLDGIGAPKLEKAVSSIAGRGENRVVLDCAGMSYISSVGLRALLICAKACQSAGARLAIAAFQPNCRKVLEVSGLLLALDHHETREAALAALDRAAPEDDVRRPVAEGGAGMEVEERMHGPVVVLALDGRLDGVGAPDLEARISAIVGRGADRVVLDCGRMTYIDSTGLRAMLICAKTCQIEGGKFAIAALRPNCRAVMDMSGFLSIIEYRATLKAALAALA